MKKNENKDILISNLLMLLAISLDIMTFLNFEVYRLYSPVIIYVNIAMCLIQLFIYRFAMGINDIIFLIGASIYGLLTILTNGNSLGAVCAYLLIFLTTIVFKLMVWEELALIIMQAATIIIMIWTLFQSGRMNLTKINPNTYGILVSLMLFYFAFFSERRPLFKQQKMILSIMFVLAFLTETKLKCRTGAIVVFLWGMFHYFVPLKILKKQINAIKIVILFILGGCIFPIVYVNLSSNVKISTFVYNLTGKYAFTGREQIWARLFSGLASSPKKLFLGIGSNAENMIGEGLSMHSSYMQILLNFGIIGIALYIIFVSMQVKDCYKKSVIEKWKIALLVDYMMILIQSYTEVVLQNDMIVLLVGMILGLASGKLNETSPKMKMDRFLQ